MLTHEDFSKIVSWCFHASTDSIARKRWSGYHDRIGCVDVCMRILVSLDMVACVDAQSVCTQGNINAFAVKACYDRSYRGITCKRRMLTQAVRALPTCSFVN